MQNNEMREYLLKGISCCVITLEDKSVTRKSYTKNGHTITCHEMLTGAIGVALKLVHSIDNNQPGPTDTLYDLDGYNEVFDEISQGKPFYKLSDEQVVKIRYGCVYYLRKALTGYVPQAFFVEEQVLRASLKTLEDMFGGETSKYYPSITNKAATTSGSSNSSSSSGGCYVATAVYGSYDCPEVWVLRRFRDFKLAKSAAGRGFIRAYYAISPSLVRRFGKAEWFKDICGKVLTPLVSWCVSKGYSDRPYED